MNRPSALPPSSPKNKEELPSKRGHLKTKNIVQCTLTALTVILATLQPPQKAYAAPPSTALAEKISLQYDLQKSIENILALLSPLFSKKDLAHFTAELRAFSEKLQHLKPLLSLIGKKHLLKDLERLITLLEERKAITLSFEEDEEGNPEIRARLNMEALSEEDIQAIYNLAEALAEVKKLLQHLK